MGVECYEQERDMQSMSNGWSDSNPTNQVGLEVQTEERRAPPLSSDETGEQSRCDSVDVESLELRQAVTKLKPQTTDFSNDAQDLKRINAQPPSAQIQDIHLNEIGAALKEFDPPINPTILGNPTCPDPRPRASVEDSHTQPKPTDTTPPAISTELKQVFNSIETSCPKVTIKKTLRFPRQPPNHVGLQLYV